MFRFCSWSDRLDPRTKGAAEEFARSIYPIFQKRSSPRPTVPEGWPGWPTKELVMSTASATGLLRSPGFEPLFHNTEGVWIKDSVGSSWMELLDRRLREIVVHAYLFQDAAQTMGEELWVSTLCGAFAMYLGAMDGEPIEYLKVYPLRLQIDRDVELPWGRLRRGSVRDGNWMGDLLMDEFRLSSEWFTRNSILEVAEEVRWSQPTLTREELASKPGSYQVGLAVSRDDIEPALVSLAGLLAADRSMAPVVWGGTYFQPFGQNGGTSWLRSDQIFESVVPRANLETMLRFSERLCQRYNDSRRLAVTRSVSATEMHRHPVDGIIDCVIVWENLLNRSRAEMAFKIAASAAVIIEPEAGRRTPIFADFKRFYNLRSQVVHGSKVPTTSEASYMRQQAVELTLDLVRASLEHPVDVWSAKDASTIEQLILGFDPSPA